MQTGCTKHDVSCILAQTKFRLKMQKMMPQSQVYLKCAFWLAPSVTAQITC